ncbi:phosphotransferase enzyme family protein [Luteolibacter algae]|uniref:Phosphotransferase enzyme family protein n=1 Tax=Luteolibacter algae TaxID=454151 RepID=A0ABW5D2X4_9BACT
MNLPEIASRFALPSHLSTHEEIPTGLINATHLLTCAGGERFILQAINPFVFKQPGQVMENIRLVTSHLSGKQGDPGTQLSLIPTKDGRDWLTTSDGALWRCYPFLENTESYMKINSPELAFRAAAAFGKFQADLVDLDASRLHETIPAFHHTPTYLAKLIKVAKEDPANRLTAARAELDKILANESLAHRLTDADLPLRVTHNDTKISNILFPINPGLAPVVIDLDTVMPGLALFDFGDLVRSAAASADEDESDSDKIFLDPALNEALTAGYLSTASSFLTDKEKELLPDSVKVITLELACRFLADYLAGDIYFKTTYPDHNLIRARNQLALFESM